MNSCCNNVSAIKENEVYSKYGGALKNTKLNFLILLNNDDYVKKKVNCKYITNENLILLNANLFNGILKCLPYNNIENEENYIIDDNPMQRIIYIKLPKENLYVSCKDFDMKYLISQHNELISIFVLLGASKIKWQISKNFDKNIDTCVNLGTNIEGIDVKIGCNYNNIKQEKFEINNEIELENRYLHLSEDAFVKNDTFYYLSKKPDWHEIISLRSSEKKYKFNFTYSSLYDFNIDLITKLKVFDITCSNKNSEFNNLMISYDVEYF
jgi:hypothetical protein